MAGELSDSPYIGKEGIVKEVKKDGWGDIQWWGSWGGIALYPDKDMIEILD